MMRVGVLSAAALFGATAMTGCGGIPWPKPTAAVPETVPDRRPQDAAVVVAVEEYAHLPPVRGAGLNASDWDGYLRRVRGLSPDRVQVLRDAEVTREHVLAAVRRAVEQTAGGGRVWFVFIGHGTARQAPEADGSREGLLIAADALRSASSIEGNSVGQGELVDLLRDREHVVLLDACFSGTDRDHEALVDDLGLVWAAPKTVPQGVVLTAARADQAAVLLSKSLRPAFSYLALGALQGWCEGRYGPADGVVTASEVARCAGEIIQRVNRDEPDPEAHGTGKETLPLATGVAAGFDFEGMIDEVVDASAPSRAGPWALIGAGLALGVVGGWAHWQNHADATEVKRLGLLADDEAAGAGGESRGATAEYNTRRGDLDASFYTAVGTYAVGAALLAAGVVWRVTLLDEDADWLAVIPSLGGLAIGFGF